MLVSKIFSRFSSIYLWFKFNSNLNRIFLNFGKKINFNKKFNLPKYPSEKNSTKFPIKFHSEAQPPLSFSFRQKFSYFEAKVPRKVKREIRKNISLITRKHTSSYMRWKILNYLSRSRNLPNPEAFALSSSQFIEISSFATKRRKNQAMYSSDTNALLSRNLPC